MESCAPRSNQVQLESTVPQALKLERIHQSLIADV